MRRAASSSPRGPVPSIGVVAMLAACLLAAPSFAQQSAATVNALADADPVPARSGPRTPTLSLTARESLPGLAPRGSVDVGVQWSRPIGGQLIDFAAWRRVTPPPDALALIQQQQQESNVYGARVEMKLAPASKRLFADRFIGLQLDSGARIGLKKSNGNPTIYYRNQF